jgi:glycosyltransferase involved in cell wall biosynthesis
MSRSSSLVLITTSFPVRGDGSEAAGSFVSDLAEELGKHLPLRVVAPGTRAAREAWCDGVEVLRFAAPDKPLSTLKPWWPSDLAALRRVITTGEAATREAVTVGPTAHMLALWALPSGHWARRISRETGVPYSVWTLGSDIWSLARIPLVRGQLRRVLREAHVCFSDGLRLAEDTRAICGREVEFLPSTRRISRKRTRPLKDSPPYRLLFLGRWHPNKGVDLLIQALKLLADEDWQRIEAVEIRGGGPLESQVRQGVASLLAAGRPVEVGGYLDKAAAEEAILRADYLLIPSRIESIPVVFSDAMKLGCPVIATPVGDLEQWVAHRRAGILAQEVSRFGLVRAIRRALAEPPLGFGPGTLSTAGDFDLTRTARTLATVALEP